MKSFRGKRAVVTGGGTGMGRELALQLATEGCAVAICDVSTENMAGTKSLCEKAAPAGTKITTHACDVSDEKQVLAFRDAVGKAHGDHVHLLFNNAGIGEAAASSPATAPSGSSRSPSAGGASITARGPSCRSS